MQNKSNSDALENMTTPPSVKLLFVDDDEDDFLLFQAAVSDIGHYPINLIWADTFEKAVDMVLTETFDIFFVDYRLTMHTGLDLMRLFRTKGQLQPFVILTGQGDHNIDVLAMEEGAADYLEKDRLSPDLLERVIRYAITRAKTLNTLRQSEKRLSILSEKLIYAQEDERKRISRELHDSTSANLTAIKYAIEKKLYETGNDPDNPDTDYFKYLINLVRETIGDVQRIYSNLHPGLLDELGVISAINRFCRGFEEVHDEIQITRAINVAETDITEKLKIVIYRVMQESMNNIARHSRADQVRFALEFDANDNLRMIVADNGRGFDVEETLKNESESSSSGLGIINMQERVAFSGGSFSLESRPGLGTTLTATWPAGK